MTGERFLIPSAGQPTTEGQAFLELEPGTVTDVNREMRGGTVTNFFPDVTFEAVPFGPITVGAFDPSTGCTGTTAPQTGRVFLETTPTPGRLHFCNGVAWMRAGEFEGALPGADIAVDDPTYPSVVTVTGPAAPHGPVARMVIITQPTTNLTGVVEVEFRDEAGNRVTTGPGSSRSIAVSLDPANGLLIGDLSQRASAGRVRFDLEVFRSGTYRLRFTSDGLAPLLSNSFTNPAGAS